MRRRPPHARPGSHPRVGPPADPAANAVWGRAQAARARPPLAPGNVAALRAWTFPRLRPHTAGAHEPVGGKAAQSASLAAAAPRAHAHQNCFAGEPHQLGALAKGGTRVGLAPRPRWLLQLVEPTSVGIIAAGFCSCISCHWACAWAAHESLTSSAHSYLGPSSLISNLYQPCGGLRTPECAPAPGRVHVECPPPGARQSAPRGAL
ncbi:MAG: hypothetical protein J3K34DRAFT_420171 [Monoraphidium minutum]|nr:MAG: hypothetical protein J3K34DRAFT_420171 [Monoraphidium minutum]